MNILTHKAKDMLRKFVKSRKGTAEIIGSVMFIVILLFFFTNVYLWHDATVREMNDLQLQKMNAGMELTFVSGSATITAKGSDVMLSRIWIVTSNNEHLYADLEGSTIRLVAGMPTQITFGPIVMKSDGSIQADGSASGITLHYPSGSITRLKVVNSLGIIIYVSQS